MKLLPLPRPSRRAALQAWGFALALISGWATLLWAGHHSTPIVGWPLGVLAGALFQKGMLEGRKRAIRRVWVPHPRWNDWLGDWLFCRPFVTRLDLERHKIFHGAAEAFQKEEASWLKILPRAIWILSGLARLMRLDFDSQWAARARAREQLPRLSALEAAANVAFWALLAAAAWATGKVAEVLLFWFLPYVCLLPAFEHEAASSEKGGPRSLRSLTSLRKPSGPANERRE